MTVSTFTQPDNTTQSGATYKTNIDGGFSVYNRSAGAFAPHAQTSPNMTVRVDAGSVFDGTTLTEVAAQSTGTITAPVTNPRIDRVVISRAAGTVSVITGAEGASPSAPAITSGNLPVCKVALAVGQTTIVNADITDERQTTSTGLVQSSENVSGVLEIATAAETTTGTDDARAITPRKLTEFSPASATIDTANDKLIIFDATDSKLKQAAFPSVSSDVVAYPTVSSSSDITISIQPTWANIGSTFSMTIPTSGLIGLGFTGCIVGSAVADVAAIALAIKIGSTVYPMTRNNNGTTQYPYVLSGPGGASPFYATTGICSGIGVGGSGSIAYLDIEALGIPTGSQTVQIVCATNEGAVSTLKGTTQTTHIFPFTVDHT